MYELVDVVGLYIVMYHSLFAGSAFTSCFLNCQSDIHVRCLYVFKCLIYIYISIIYIYIYIHILQIALDPAVSSRNHTESILRQVQGFIFICA